MDVTTKPKALPKSLHPDLLGRMSFACRVGWHQWHYPNEYGTFAFDRFQLKQCLRCNRKKWARIGYAARRDA